MTDRYEILKVPLPDTWPPPSGAVRHGIRAPIGTVRIKQLKRTQVREIKVALHLRGGSAWMRLARFWWLRHMGAIPAGKVVLHVDGDALNDDPENYALGTTGDHITVMHMDNPGWSSKQHRAAGHRTAQANRDRARVRWLTDWLAHRWYAVDRARGIVWLPPHKTMAHVYAPFLGESFAPNANGRGILQWLFGWPELSTVGAAIMHVLTMHAGIEIDFRRLSAGIRELYQRYDASPPRHKSAVVSAISALRKDGLVISTRHGRDGSRYRAATSIEPRPVCRVVAMKGPTLATSSEAQFYERRFVDEPEFALKREKIDVVESLQRMAQAMAESEAA